MAKTLANIRSQVRSLLDEPSEADWLDTELNALINVHYHEVYSEVLDVFEDYAPLSTQTIATAVNTQEYDLSAYLVLKLRRVEIKFDSSATAIRQRAFPVKIDDVQRDLASQSLGPTVLRNPGYYYIGNLLGFIPVPSTVVADAIKIWFHPKKTDLTSDSDTIDLPYADRDWLLIAYAAAADALRYGQQESVEADKLDRKYENGLDIMKQRLEDRVADDSKSVTDVSGLSLDFS